MRHPAVRAAQVCVGLVLAVLALPLLAGVAAAHGGGADEPPADSLPRVLAVEPPVPGLDVVVIDGAQLRIDNRTDRPVTVLPAAQADRDGVPVVAPGTSAAWADPRLGDPAAAWAVPLSVGGQPVTVRGDRVWPAPPHPFPWWALTVAALLGTFAVGGAAVERGGRGGPTTALAAVPLVVAAAYVVHVVGSSLVLAEPPGFGVVLAGTGFGVACWALGPVAAALTLRGHVLGPAAYGLLGFLTALLTASDTTSFHRAVLAFGWAADLDRITVVIAVGGGLGLLLTAIAAPGLCAHHPPDPGVRGPLGQASVDAG